MLLLVLGHHYQYLTYKFFYEKDHPCTHHSYLHNASIQFL